MDPNFWPSIKHLWIQDSDCQLIFNWIVKSPFLQGGMSKEDLISWHRPRIEALSEARVDFFAVETQPTWQEAVAVLDCIQQIDPVLPVWVTFTVKNCDSIANGESLKEAVNQITHHSLYGKGRIFALGVNCSAPTVITAALDTIRTVSKTLPLVVYANSGETWNGQTRQWDGTPKDWEQCVGEWLKRGTLIFGGCCRVDSEQIMKLRVAVAKALMNQLKT